MHAANDTLLWKHNQSDLHMTLKTNQGYLSKCNVNPHMDCLFHHNYIDESFASSTFELERNVGTYEGNNVGIGENVGFVVLGDIVGVVQVGEIVGDEIVDTFVGEDVVGDLEGAALGLVVVSE